VTLYTFSLQYPSFLFPGKTQYSESPPPTDLNIKVVINSIHPLNWLKVARMIVADKPDLVVARYWMPFMAPSLGTIVRRVKSRLPSTEIVAHVDNALPHEKRPGDKILTRYFVKSIDRFVVMSDKVKADLLLFTDKPVAMTLHPLYDNFGQGITKAEARKILGLPTDRYIYLFFGFIRKYKGLDMLISAFEQLQTDRRSALLIAGEFYAGEDDIKAQIDASSRQSDIYAHTDFIKDEDVYLYFSAADSVIQPYRDATQSGVTPLAYHFEVPMMVTRVGALPDLVPPSLGVVTEPNIEAIRDGLSKMQNLDMATFNTSIKVEKVKLSWETYVKVLLGSR
jgi:glycosyltransferase involved in cell wall biosynthesis